MHDPSPAFAGGFSCKIIELRLAGVKRFFDGGGAAYEGI
jgi:hypothetical protein